MQTFSYYSRNLVVEQVQRTIFTKRVKPINGYYYIYFKLSSENRLLIKVDSRTLYTEGYLKYEDRDKKDIILFKGYIKNINHITKISEKIDLQIEKLNLKNNLIFDEIEFENIDYDFDSIN